MLVKNSEKEIKDLTLELQSVSKKLKDSEALKSHFISNISNEIVNPFTSILGLSKQYYLLKSMIGKRLFQW